MRTQIKLLAGAALLLLTPLSVTGAGLDQAREIAPFAAEVAREHGLNEEAVQKTLANAKVLNKVLKAISTPAEGKPWKDYRPIFLGERRIADGASYWRKNAATLKAASERFGVSEKVIVAIIGVETLYGQRAGNIRVLDALATLGFRYPKRAKFFRKELSQFMALSTEEALDPLRVQGSYAGAMGIGQFIPSSYRVYAVDFNDDGRRDLLSSHEDAIGSVASYLARHGWQRNGPVSVQARVKGADVGGIVELGAKPHMPLPTLLTRGVTPTAAVPGSPKAALINLKGRSGVEHWVVFQNFYAITRYNRSNLYAMAVHQLSNAIEERYRAGTQ